MKANEALELARSHNVEVRLNADGNGLDLEVDDDPPQALVNILTSAKHDIVAILRQQEIDRRRPLITRWINDHFTSTPPGVCLHCGNGAREGDIFVRLYCGDDSGDIHASCQPVWRKAEETRAHAALGLAPLSCPADTHPLPAARELSRPPDAFNYGLAYRERIKMAGEDGRKEEVKLRALEAVVRFYRTHHPVASVDVAKTAVLASIKGEAAP